MRRSSVILQHLWPLNSADLGLLVANPKEPTQGAYRSPLLDSYSEIKGDYGVSRSYDYKALIDSTSGLSLGAKAQEFFHALFQIDNEDKSSLDGHVVRTYVLNDQDGKFLKILEEKEGKQWIERYVRKRKGIYVVVGYQTVCNARFNKEDKNSGQLDVSAKVTDPHTQAGGEVSVAGKRALNQTARFNIKEEQIYAVQYRKIVWDLFSSKDTDKANLDDKSTWVVSWKVRGTSQETRVDEVLKVSLSEQETTFDEDLGLICEPNESLDEILYFSN